MCWVLVAGLAFSWVVMSIAAVCGPVGSSRTRDQTCIPCLGGRIPYHWATREAPWLLSDELVWLYVCMYAHVRMVVCMHVWYMWACVWVGCVCVCERETERDRDRLVCADAGYWSAPREGWCRAEQGPDEEITQKCSKCSRSRTPSPQRKGMNPQTSCGLWKWALQPILSGWEGAWWCQWRVLHVLWKFH